MKKKKKRSTASQNDPVCMSCCSIAQTKILSSFHPMPLFVFLYHSICMKTIKQIRAWFFLISLACIENQSDFCFMQRLLPDLWTLTWLQGGTVYRLRKALFSHLQQLNVQIERRNITICFDNFTFNVYFLGYHRTKIAVRDCMLIRNFSWRRGWLNHCPCLLKVSEKNNWTVWLCE